MFFQDLHHKVTRARPTSNMMFSAAAIAVVSEVNPDEPGAFFLLFLYKILLCFILLISSMTAAHALAFQQTKAAMNSAIYNNTLLSVTPMLFHHIELGMSYEAVVNITGKSALYCDSGESYCNADNGAISTKCLDTEFIQPNKTWMCHWDGKHASRNANTRLDVWFVGARVSQVTAIMPNGSIYRRDTNNTIHLERHDNQQPF